jgi:membrane-associated phospholipid phosphatase
MKPFLAWPGWRHLAEAAALTLIVNVLFAVVYFGANFAIAHRLRHWHLFLRSELAIPLWPAAIVVYDSLYLLFLLAPFVLRTPSSFRRLARSAAVVIVVAGVCFLLLPAELGFAAPVVRGPFQAIFEVSDRVNLDYNLVPSLHVALAVVCLQAFWPTASRPIRVALVAWGAGLALSTLLTHQHHVLDVLTGAVLAAITTQLFGRAGDVA